MDRDLKKSIRKCTSGNELAALLNDVVPTELVSSDIELINHVIEKCDPDRDYRIAYLGNYTLDALSRHVSVHSAINGKFASSYIGEYNQFFQEVINKDGGLVKFNPDILFLSLSMRELAPDVHSSFLSLSRAQKQDEIERITSMLDEWAGLARNNTGATVLISNFTRPARPAAGVADMQLEMGEAEFYAELNLELLRMFKEDTRVFLFDLENAVSRLGKTNAYSPRMYYLAKMEWSEAALPEIAQDIWKYIRAAGGHTRKCLVLDLDNTLWGGIVGEDGVHGIKIGHGDAEAEAFLDFQYLIRSFIERGVVLAVCSKNNPEDVDEVFSKRKDMVLARQDFSVMKVNWEHKHINIEKIANELNIGIDSLVFVDDNPAECALVSQALPEVATIQLPSDPSDYAVLLSAISEFEKLFLTDEDRSKTEQYRSNLQREKRKQNYSDINDFLDSLGTVVEISDATEGEQARAHQLFSKTNQFNLTTIRYTPSDIEKFIVDPAWDLKVIQVEDNFGDLGIVGLYLVQLVDKKATIDSFVLSCRALGRGVETCMMNAIKRDYLEKGACSILQGRFVPTAKNKPAAIFYETQGFELVESVDDEHRYQLVAGNARMHDTPGISLK